MYHPLDPRNRNPPLWVRALGAPVGQLALGAGAIAARGVAGFAGDTYRAIRGGVNYLVRQPDPDSRREIMRKRIYADAVARPSKRSRSVPVRRKRFPKPRMALMPYRGRIPRAYSGMRPELYAKDTLHQNIDTSTIFPRLLNGIARGTAVNQRRGNKVNPIKVTLHGSIRALGSNLPNTVSSEYRIMVVWDSNPNGAYAILSDILSPTDTGYVHAFRNLDNTQRFTILYDKIFKLAPAGSTGGVTVTSSPNLITINKTINIPGPFRTRYDADNDAIDGISEGAILLFVGVDPTTQNELGTVNIGTRLRYYDT